MWTIKRRPTTAKNRRRAKNFSCWEFDLLLFWVFMPNVSITPLPVEELNELCAASLTEFVYYSHLSSPEDRGFISCWTVSCFHIVVLFFCGVFCAAVNYNNSNISKIKWNELIIHERIGFVTWVIQCTMFISVKCIILLGFKIRWNELIIHEANDDFCNVNNSVRTMLMSVNNSVCTMFMSVKCIISIGIVELWSVMWL